MYFMQGIYPYIPKTKNVCRIHSVAAIQYLQFLTHEMLFPVFYYYYYYYHHHHLLRLVAADVSKLYHKAVLLTY